MPTPFADEKFFLALLAKAVAGHASDVHVKVGPPPGARIRGDMIYFRTEKVTPEDTTAVARFVIKNQNVLAKLVAPGGTLSAVYTIIAEKVALEIEKLQDEAAEPAEQTEPAGPPSATVESGTFHPTAAAG